MSAGIKAGDLVMVVKAQLCCGLSDELGYVYAVLSVAANVSMCRGCRRIYSDEPIAYSKHEGGFPLQCVIKIDPPALPEETEAPEEVEA